MPAHSGGTDPVPPEHTFRRDIQGLRAIAVVLVVLDHAGVSYLAGGYIGVDVFFVISGFLITGWILRGSEKARRVRFRAFYVARARRILPAAALTLVATTIASRYLLNPVRALSTFHDAIWAAFFAANVHFAQVGTNYFSSGAPPSPLQNFWSLAVEEQFYVAWPAVLMITLFVLRRAPLRFDRLYRRLFVVRHEVDRAAIRRLVVILGVVIVASLVWSVHDTANDPTGAYFSTLTRAWELGVGALIAVCTPFLSRPPEWIKASASWVGLSGVLGAAVWFNAGTPFPGYAALLPVSATALIVVGGLNGPGPSRRGAAAFLNLRPLRCVGDVSYSFYLWHWPVLVIAMEYEGHKLSVPTNLLLLAGAFGLSVFTYKVYEDPLHRKDFRIVVGHARSHGRRWLGLILWPLSVLTVLFVAEVCLQSVQSELSAKETLSSTPGEATTTSTSATPGVAATTTTSSMAVEPATTSPSGALPVLPPDSYTNAVAASISPERLRETVPNGLSPPFQDLTGTTASLGTCIADATPQSTTSEVCHLGAVKAKRTLVVFGDSHAAMWMTPLAAFGSATGWDIVPMIKEGCSAPGWSSAYNNCDIWYHWAVSQIMQIRPSAIIFSSSYSNIPKTNPDGDNGLVAAMASEVKVLLDLSPQVIVFEDVPGLGQNPVDCLLARGATLGSCTFPLSSALVSEDTNIYQVVTEGGGAFLQTIPWFCAENQCPTVIGDTISYVDQNHVSNTYATELAKPLATGLDAVLK